MQTGLAWPAGVPRPGAIRRLGLRRHLTWGSDASREDNTYILPAGHNPEILSLPPSGLENAGDLKKLRGAAVIHEAVESAVSPSVYAFTGRTTRRNLYRAPFESFDCVFSGFSPLPRTLLQLQVRKQMMNTPQ
jgi:hypothetical protein